MFPADLGKSLTPQNLQGYASQDGGEGEER